MIEDRRKKKKDFVSDFLSVPAPLLYVRVLSCRGAVGPSTIVP